MSIWDFAGIPYATEHNHELALLDNYDAIVFHYTIMHNMCWKVFGGEDNDPLKELYLRLIEYPDVKKIFTIQDEYYDTGRLNKIVDIAEPYLILTCIPQKHVREIYRCSNDVKLHSVLTGYVDDSATKRSDPLICDRTTAVFYRGRPLEYWYGDLGQDKTKIGLQMKEYCDKYRIVSDISVLEEDRLYGDAWMERLSGAKATLSSESGSNVFHFDDSIIEKCNELQKDENYSYAQAKSDLKIEEGSIYMGQISPKMFEAASCKTALIMFEGVYNEIFEPGVHFIELKKDFSNVDSVLERLADDHFLQSMANVTYRDIIESGRYSYKNFIKTFDDLLD